MRKALTAMLVEQGRRQGTLFWIDPKRKLMALHMVQLND